MSIEEFRAIVADDPAFLAALRDAGLPSGDIDGADRRFFVRLVDGAACAWGGLEGEGSDRLLRSLVVAEDRRGAGHGRAMAAALEREARRLGVRRLWLLTASAADAFLAWGWRRVDRRAAPPAIAGTKQFRELCPASAVCLGRDLAEA